MHFVLLGTHSPETCPTSNKSVRDLMHAVGPDLPLIADKAGVKILAGPETNREHLLVVVVEADKAEAVDKFLVESRLAHWNSIRVLPSIPLQEAVQEIDEYAPVF